MARRPRIEYAGAMYHVMCRGNDRKKIALDDEDRERFAGTLREACGRTGWRVRAYVLMGNHYHWLLRTPEPNLAAGMQWFQTTWTQRFNVRHGRCGHLFQGRYKALSVEDDPRYFSVVADYIHLNPVRAGLLDAEKETLAGYRWSSYPAYLAPSKRPSWLEVDEVLGELGYGDDRRGRESYRRQMARRMREVAGGREAREGNWKEMSEDWCYGTDSFKEALLARLGGLVGSKGARSSYSGEVMVRHDEAQAERLLTEGMKRLGIHEGDFGKTAKGDPVKVVLALMLKERTAVSNSWIAHRLRCGHAANLPRYVRRAMQAERGSQLETLKKTLKCEA